MKKLLIISVILIALGGCIFVGAMAAGGWDFSKIGSGTLQTSTHTVEEDFESILVDTDTADISFLPAEDGMCRIVCYEREKEKHTARVKDGRLEIELHDERKWYEHISLGFESPKITVYLPKSEYKTLNIDESTGDIRLPAGFTFESASIELSTGNLHLGASVTGNTKIKSSTGNVSLTAASLGSLDVELSTGDVHLDSLTVEGSIKVKKSTGALHATAVSSGDISVIGSTGNVTLKEVISSGTVSVTVSTGEVSLTETVAERFSLSTDTGDVIFRDSDAKHINASTDTGDVEGTLLSPKLFHTETDTGKVSVPSPSGSEPCIIETDTGDIRISISSN